MKKKTNKKPEIRIRKKTQRGRPRKIAEPIDKTKLAFQEIRKEFKRLKKSKQRMQFLWYRTKKEHVALMKDLDKRIKKLKAEIKKSKSTGKAKPIKRIVKKTVAKNQKARKPIAMKSEAKKRILRKAATKNRLGKKSSTTKPVVRNNVTKTIEKQVTALPPVSDQSPVVTPEGDKS